MLCCCCSQFSIFFSPIKVIFHLGSQNWQEEEELPSGFISSPLKCFLLRISVGIEEASVHGRRKTFQSEAVNLRSGPQVCPRLSDMLNRSTLTLSAASAFPTHPFWCVVPSIYHLSPGGGGGGWKLTMWFAFTEKYHQRAVHLGPTAAWCQDWRWPKARRTESSSERSRGVVFPSCASVTSSCRGEPRGAIWRGPGPEHGELGTANCN